MPIRQIIKVTDVNAAEKLQSKIDELLFTNSKMKQINKHYKQFGNLDECEDIDIEEISLRVAENLQRFKKPFPECDFVKIMSAITYNRNRLKALNREKMLQPIEILEKGFLCLNLAINEHQTLFEAVINRKDFRIQIIFDGPVKKELSKLMFSHGFKYSPSKKLWQRQLTENGLTTTKQLLAILREN